MDEEVGAWDAVLIDPLTQESFISNLHQRYKLDLIYTYIGNMLVSINPYRQLPGYCKELTKTYACRGPYQLPPHIFGVAGSAWRLLRDGSNDQVIVLTGEAGAGKSDAVRALLVFLSHASPSSHASPAVVGLLHADSVLQAFGHAYTSRNHNSSRFGKYLDVEFDFKGEPIRGNVTCYLLEKSRVTSRPPSDRNFHIFYQVVIGADIHLLKLLKLHRNVDKYALLSGAPPACRREDKTDFTATKSGLEAIGLSAEEILSVFRVVSAVLKLGNLLLLPTTNMDGTEACTISNDYEVYETCELLGADSVAMMEAITCHVSTNHECPVSTGLSCGEAATKRDALCRALYSRLFAYLVTRVNDVAKVSRRGRRKLLGILDLYGSEALERNGFEQLVINVCEEKLHHVVMTAVLKDEQEEYTREGIDWQPIIPLQPLCELTLHNQLEMLSLMDDASCTTDESYTTRVIASCGARAHTEARNVHMPALTFRVQHFLGPVTYIAAGFTERNRDGVSREVSRVLWACQNPLMPLLFPEGHPALPQGPGAASTCAQCRLAMCALTRTLQTKQPHYVRCIRPNSQQLPRVFDAPFVQHQVLCFGLVETARVRRQGFCFSQDVNVFLERYKMLSSATWPRWYRGSSREGVVLLLRDLPIPSGEFTFGRSKLFVRSPRTVYELEEFRRARLHDLAVLIQKTWRCHFLRARFLRMRRSQQIIVSAWRSWRECRMGIPFEGRRHLWCLYRIAREEYRVVKRRHQVEWAVSIIQKYFIRWKRRCYLMRLSSALRSKEMESPICHAWPIHEAARNPRYSETCALLKRLHHKWRCHKYRMGFDQTARNRMREKVTASIIFRDRKASYLRSVSHPFLGDYVRLRQNMQWKRMAAETNDQYVVFADLVHKVARSSGKLVPALLVLSTSAMLLLDQRTLQIKSRVPAHEIYRLSLSPYLDGVAVFHIRAPCMATPDGSDGPGGCLFQGEMGRKKGDLVFQTGHVIEVVTKLFLVVQNAAGKPPEVNITTDLEANFGQQTVTVSFRCVGMPEVPPGQIRIMRKGAKMEVLV